MDYHVCSIKLCGMKGTFESSDTFIYLCVRHKLLFSKELNATLREQIARGIKELAPKLLARWIEAGDPWVENWNYLDEENAQRIVEFIAAAIARGNDG